jgi:hypothetical protein
VSWKIILTLCYCTYLGPRGKSNILCSVSGFGLMGKNYFDHFSQDQLSQEEGGCKFFVF